VTSFIYSARECCFSLNDLQRKSSHAADAARQRGIESADLKSVGRRLAFNSKSLAIDGVLPKCAVPRYLIRY
jgi:hypothetical protein